MEALKWTKSSYGGNLQSGPFMLIKRRKDGRIFWIARVEVDSTGQDSRNYEIIIYGANLREAKACAQKLVGTTHFKDKKIAWKS